MSTFLTQELDPDKQICANISPMLQSNKILCHNIYYLFPKILQVFKETVL
jgi:hypothetical protein